MNSSRLACGFVVVLSLAVPVSAWATQRPSPRLLIPVVANKAGANGTYFRSEITLTNHRDIDQAVSLHYYAVGEFFYGDPKFETTVMLPARGSITYTDVLSAAFPPHQLSDGKVFGTLVIGGASSSGRQLFDDSARLSATYRIWTAAPDGSGTMSQSSAALALDELSEARLPRVVIGAREDVGFRCNVGIVSLTFEMRDFLVTAASPKGTTSMVVSAGRYSLTQVPLPAAGLGHVIIRIEPLNLQPADIWTAYASSVDNTSGDAWLGNAVAESRGSARFDFPEVARTRREGGTFRRTDLHLYNNRNAPQELIVVFVGQVDGPAGNSTVNGSVALRLGPFEAYTLEDVLDHVISGEPRSRVPEAGIKGHLWIRAAISEPHDFNESRLDPEARLVASYRTYEERGGGGSVSEAGEPVSVEGYPVRSSGVVAGLRQDRDFRTGLVIFNPSSLRFHLRVEGPGHSPVDVYTMPSGNDLQHVELPWNSGPLAVRIQQLDGDVLDEWSAVASTTDLRSGDSWMQNLVKD
jgi:hypothetical protein